MHGAWQIALQGKGGWSRLLAMCRWMEAEQRERTALHLARSEMLAAVRAFIPDFNPQQEFLDYSEWPLVAIRRVGDHLT